MAATGADDPVIYILGEAPGKTEDDEGKQFVGSSGKILRRRIPKTWLKKIRWNNCVRTRPPKNRTPSPIEIECCRPSVIRDIEKTKPKAIFGMGGIPLTWATGLSGISFWAGRMMPVQIGSHVCWFFPMYHPSYIGRMDNGKGQDGYGSEEEFAFELHLERAFDAMKKLPKPVVHSPEFAQQDIDIISGAEGNSDVKKILRMFEEMAAAPIVGLDYETNALRPYLGTTKILTAALSSDERTVAFPMRHSDCEFTPKQLRKVEGAWKEFLEESDCVKAVHNLVFELEWSVVKFGEGTLRNGRWGCSQSQAYILDERVGSGVQSLDGLSLQYFGLSMKSLNPVDRANLDNTPLPKVLKYNGVDARYHRLLFQRQAVRLKEEGLEEQYYHNLERTAGVTLMTVKGLPADEKVARGLEKKYTARIEKYDKKLLGLDSVKAFQRRRGRAFNAGSNKDVKELLVKHLGQTIGKVDEEALKPIKGPAPRLILKRRKIAKLLSTYVLPALPGSPVLFDGWFHPIYGVTTTRTWRTSSDSPNAQNWPKYEGKEVRKIVQAPPGYRIVTFDYAGIQARNVAMESKDRALVKAFRERYDIHSDWMERIVKHYPQWMPGGVKGLKDKALRKHHRQQAKNKLVFPLFFGAGSYTTSTGLGIPNEIGQILGKEFQREFPGIAGWQKQLRKDYRKTGYVTGLSGFRRRAPVAPTEIINTPIQSDESVIVLDALIRLTDLGEECFYPSIEIHDDLTFVWQKEDVEKNAEVVIGMMLDVPFEWAHIVPMGVEMGIGTNWADIETVGEWYSDEWHGHLKQEEVSKII